MVTCAARWNVLGGRQGGCCGWGGGQVSEAVVLSKIISLRIYCTYCSKTLAMNKRFFSKSSNVFGTLRRIGRTILHGEKAHVVLRKHLSYGRLRGTFGIPEFISRFFKTQRGVISVQSSMNPTYFCPHVQQEFHLHQSEFHMNTICTSHLINQTPLQERKRTFFLQNIYKLSPYLWICLAEFNTFIHDSKANSRNIWTLRE